MAQIPAAIDTILAIGVYFLGMLSGWNVVAFMRSSLRRVTAHRHQDS